MDLEETAQQLLNARKEKAAERSKGQLSKFYSWFLICAILELPPDVNNLAHLNKSIKMLLKLRAQNL